MLALVGKGPEQPADYLLPEIRFGEQFLDQADFRDVGGRRKLLRDVHPLGDAKHVQLDPIDREGAPPHLRCPFKPRRLPGLARVQDRQQSQIDDDQGLGLSHQSSGKMARRKYSTKRLSLRMGRCNEEG